MDGAVKFGDTANAAPEAGTVRWNPTIGDFEGYTGTEWKSMTQQGNTWGIMVHSSTENGQAASDGAADDRFGRSVSISGNHAIVGAQNHDIGVNSSQGKVYIFQRLGSDWVEVATLTPSDGAASDYFGGSVSISGDHTIVGAYLHDTGGNSDQGKVYFFNK